MGLRWGKGWGAVLVVFLLVVGAACSKTEEKGRQPKPAPDFDLVSVDGNHVRLSDLRGKVVLLDFWATWCPPCRVAIPHLVELQRKYRKEGLVVIGMNMDQDPDELAQFMARTTFNYPVVRVDETTRMAYGGISSIPQAFLIDRAGYLRHSFMGFSPDIGRDMEEKVRRLLEEKPAE
ncbi:MAG: TlpA family protein disulfide reductase [Deltaproteobacteria bacterium]|nr:TlpA family protein disulfide reductase [Deltaproteobacteria bacterium]